MSFKEKYKKLKNFRNKFCSNTIFFCGLSLTLIFSSVNSLYDKYQFQQNNLYEPFSKEISLPNGTRPKNFSILDNDEKIYNHENKEIFLFLNNKLKTIENEIIKKKETFEQKSFVSNYIKYIDQKELDITSKKILKIYNFSTFKESLFFENNSEYVILDKYSNISQSNVILSKNYYYDLDNLFQVSEFLSEKKEKFYETFYRYDNNLFIIKKDDTNISIAIKNKEKSEIEGVFIMNKDGRVFVSKSNTSAYSKIAVQNYLTEFNIKDIDFEIFLLIISTFLYYLASFFLILFILNIYLFYILTNYIKVKKNNEIILKKEIKHVE